ncbi:hypothetical protein ACFXGI_12050 [Streptomyces sp. NPDC059355]
MADRTDEWEYMTYAPPGNECSACRQEVQLLDPVRRRTLQQGSGAAVVV